MMLTDRELFVQMIERDVINLYNQLAKQNSILTLKPVQDKIYSYADVGIEYITNLLFGTDNSVNIDEAGEMARLVAEDKINHYRDRLKNKKAEMNESNHSDK